MTHLRAIPTLAPEETLADALRRTTRAFTFAELASMASARKARTAVVNGHAARVLPDAYVAGIHAESFAARADAALLWSGLNGALSGPAALYVWGFLAEPPEVIDLVMPHPLHHQIPRWLRIRRINWQPPLARLRAMTVVGASHAVVLGYGLLPARDRSTVVHAAIASGMTSVDQLLDTLAAVPRVPSRRALVRTLEAAELGAESHLEEHSARKVFNTGEFERFIRQHRVLAGGQTHRLDMFDPATLTNVELDSEAHHGNPDQRRRDLRRDARLATVGIQAVRLDYRDLMERPDWCRTLVRGVLVSRERRLSDKGLPL
ncbi:hypothetical protein [Demequina mangrovi]|uniref:DUF559 domain-containing protein n=1 Tax=Demequina mangrovi TaxID=1043493 RepID=A0A1H6ZH49_9MICO|nr:hypothetical protein [Demequina mangrovi]SEJ52739.1 hypothetical protein SAMN05421637_2153 [Demequina mangrovi]